MHHLLTQLASAGLDRFDHVWASKLGKMHLPLTLLTSTRLAITWRPKVVEVLAPLAQVASPGPVMPWGTGPQKLHTLFLVVLPRSILAQRSKVGEAAGPIPWLSYLDEIDTPLRDGEESCIILYNTWTPYGCTGPLKAGW